MRTIEEVQKEFVDLMKGVSAELKACDPEQAAGDMQEVLREVVEATPQVDAVLEVSAGLSREMRNRVVVPVFEEQILPAYRRALGVAQRAPKLK